MKISVASVARAPPAAFMSMTVNMTESIPMGTRARAATAYALALVPIGMLSVMFTVMLMNAAGGALATLATLIFMQLLVVFPAVEPYLLTTQLNAYASPVADLAWVAALILVYAALFAVVSVVLFERKDF